MSPALALTVYSSLLYLFIIGCSIAELRERIQDERNAVSPLIWTVWFTFFLGMNAKYLLTVYLATL